MRTLLIHAFLDGVIVVSIGRVVKCTTEPGGCHSFPARKESFGENSNVFLQKKSLKDSLTEGETGCCRQRFCFELGSRWWMTFVDPGFDGLVMHSTASVLHPWAFQ